MAEGVRKADGRSFGNVRAGVLVRRCGPTLWAVCVCRVDGPCGCVRRVGWGVARQLVGGDCGSSKLVVLRNAGVPTERGVWWNLR